MKKMALSGLIVGLLGWFMYWIALRKHEPDFFIVGLILHGLCVALSIGAILIWIGRGQPRRM